MHESIICAIFHRCQDVGSAPPPWLCFPSSSSLHSFHLSLMSAFNCMTRQGKGPTPAASELRLERLAAPAAWSQNLGINHGCRCRCVLAPSLSPLIFLPPIVFEFHLPVTLFGQTACNTKSPPLLPQGFVLGGQPDPAACSQNLFIIHRYRRSPPGFPPSYHSWLPFWSFRLHGRARERARLCCLRASSREVSCSCRASASWPVLRLSSSAASWAASWAAVASCRALSSCTVHSYEPC